MGSRSCGDCERETRKSDLGVTGLHICTDGPESGGVDERGLEEDDQSRPIAGGAYIWARLLDQVLAPFVAEASVFSSSALSDSTRATGKLVW